MIANSYCFDDGLGVVTVKLYEEGKLNLDDPVQKYVASFPEKQVNSKPCTITIHHLLCHQSGIRHYHKIKRKEDKSPTTEETKGHCGLVIFHKYIEMIS